MAQLSTAPRDAAADQAVVRVRPAAAPDAAGHPDIVRTWAKTPDRARAEREVAALTARLIEDTGAGLQLAEADLAGLDMHGFDLRKSTLNRALLHSTDLSGADLSGANLICPGMERTKFRGANLSGAYIHAFAAQVCDFSGADLSRLVDATGSLFHGCNLSRTRLDGAAIAGTAFYQCALDGASFIQAKLQGSTINECTMTGVDFGRALVSQLTITKSLMTGASFARASGEGLVLQRLTGADGLDLRDAHLPSLRLDSVKAAKVTADNLGAPGADIRACELNGARLRHAALETSRWVASHFEGADLSEARLDGAIFNNCAARGIRLEGAAAENLSAVECGFAGAQMRHFAGRCASFRDCDLSGADLRDAYLYRASFTGDPPRSMAMAGAVLAGAVLVQSYIAADLSGADLSGARCAYARLNQCILRGADLSGVALYEASMVKTDCTDVHFTTLKPPVFADRAAGLIEALEAARTGEASEDMVAFLHKLDALLRGPGRGST